MRLLALLARNACLAGTFARARGWTTSRSQAGAGDPGCRYALYVPKGGRGESAWPLIVALHGRRGTIYEFGLSAIARFAERYQCVVACPGRRGGIFEDDAGEAVIRAVMAWCRIDLDRVYLIGLSVGVRSVIRMGLRSGRIFSGLAGFYGDVTEADLQHIAANDGRAERIPVFVAHGTRDTTVPLASSLRLVERFRAAGHVCKLRVVDNLGHTLRTVDAALPHMFEFFFSDRDLGPDRTQATA